jgi:AAA+ superfamily predicted ATPase
MFMTANRMSILDKAVESRIHIRIKYPELDAASRRIIWRNFTEMLPKENIKLSDGDLDLLAERPMNGRQIKNAIKAAELLSVEQQQPLGFTQIDTVLSITQPGVDLVVDSEPQICSHICSHGR